MKIVLLSLLGTLLVCSAAWAADADVDADASVAVENSAPVEVSADVDADVTVDAEPRRGSLRDEYRQWSRSSNTTRRASRTSSGRRIDVNPDSTDDFDSVNDIDGAGRDLEDWVNEDVANSDRDDYVDQYDRTRVTTRRVDRYADYPEYDDAVVGDRIGDDRMYDDYDRGAGSDRYWSRSYGDVRYYDSRGGGCPCNSCTKCGRGGGCDKCGAKCGSKCGSKCGKCASHKPAVMKCGSKCGGCTKCASHKPAVTKCGSKCGSKCNKCASHKPAASCNKCGRSKCGGKCESKCGKCGSKKCSCGGRPAARKCSKC